MEGEHQVTSIKVVRGLEIKRFDIPTHSTFVELLELLQELFKDAVCTVKYKDEDDDLVTVTSEEEFKEALLLASKSGSLLKLFLTNEVSAEKLKVPESFEFVSSSCANSITSDPKPAAVIDLTKPDIESLQKVCPLSLTSQKATSSTSILQKSNTVDQDFPFSLYYNKKGEINKKKTRKMLMKTLKKEYKKKMKNEKVQNKLMVRMEGCSIHDEQSNEEEEFRKTSTSSTDSVLSSTTCNIEVDSSKLKERGSKTDRKKKDVRKRKRSSSSSSSSSSSRSTSPSSSSSSSSSSDEEKRIKKMKKHKKKKSSSADKNMKKLFKKLGKQLNSTITENIQHSIQANLDQSQMMTAQSISHAVLSRLEGAVIQSIRQEGIPTNISTASRKDSTSDGSISADATNEVCSFEKWGKYHHQNVICDFCEQEIFGPRYKCGNCTDYDLCETCESIEGIHNPSHVFLKLHYPCPHAGRLNTGGMQGPLLKKNLYEEWDNQREKEVLLNKILDSGSEAENIALESFERKIFKDAAQKSREAKEARKDEWKKMKKEAKKSKKQLARKLKRQAKMRHQQPGESHSENPFQIPSIEHVVGETHLGEVCMQDETLTTALSGLKIAQMSQDALQTQQRHPESPQTPENEPEKIETTQNDPLVENTSSSLISLVEVKIPDDIPQEVEKPNDSSVGCHESLVDEEKYKSFLIQTSSTVETDGDSVVVVSPPQTPYDLEAMSPSCLSPQPSEVLSERSNSLTSEDFIVVSKYFDPSVPLDDESMEAHEKNCSQDHDLCMCMVDSDHTVLVTDEEGMLFRDGLSSSYVQEDTQALASITRDRSQPVPIDLTMEPVSQSNSSFDEEPSSKESTLHDPNDLLTPEMKTEPLESQPSDYDIDLRIEPVSPPHSMSGPTNLQEGGMDEEVQIIRMVALPPTPSAETVSDVVASGAVAKDGAVALDGAVAAEVEDPVVRAQREEEDCLKEKWLAGKREEDSLKEMWLAGRRAEDCPRSGIGMNSRQDPSSIGQSSKVLPVLEKKTSIGDVLSDFVANVVDGVTSAANAVGETVTNVITAGDDDDSYHGDPPFAIYRPDVAEVVTQRSPIPASPIHLPPSLTNPTASVATSNQVPPSAPPPSPIREDYRSGLQQLNEMGFFDAESNRRLLNKYHGDVTKCVAELVAISNNDWHQTRH